MMKYKNRKFNVQECQFGRLKYKLVREQFKDDMKWRHFFRARTRYFQGLAKQARRDYRMGRTEDFFDENGELNI